MNNFFSNQINPKAGVPQGSMLRPLLFLIYVNDLPAPHHNQNSLSQFADDTAQWAFSLNVRFAAKLLQQDLLKLAMWCAKWRIKLNPKKTKVIIFSRSILARKTELNLKLYGETLKIFPQVKFLGITFDSQLNFKKHFEDILDRCNTRYYRLRLLANKKWGPSPSTLIQIYKQCVRENMQQRHVFKVSPLSRTKIMSREPPFLRLSDVLKKISQKSLPLTIGHLNQQTYWGVASFVHLWLSKKPTKNDNKPKILEKPTIKDKLDSNCPKYTEKAQVIFSFKKPIVWDRTMFVWA